MTSDADRPSGSPSGSEGFGAVDAGVTDRRSGVDYPVTGAPSDNTTLVSVLKSFEERGYTAQFIPADDGMVDCAGCGSSFAATELVVEAIRRLEGASDPDDMMTVIAARCPNCGVSGTLVLGYGPNATANDAAISAAIGRRPPTGRTDQPDVDPDAPGSSLFRDGDAVEPNEPA